MSLAGNFKQSTYLGYVAILRIFVGFHFLQVSWAKLSGNFLAGQRLPEELLHGIAKDPWAWHRSFITGFVVPHAHAFSYLVAFGEMAIALSLIFGFLVRISSSVGAFYNLNIYLAVALPNGGAQAAFNRLFVLLHLIFVLTAAGRALGLDGVMRRRFRGWLF